MGDYDHYKYNIMYDCSRSAITLNNLNLPGYDVHSRQARDQMLVNLYELQESFVKINDQLNAKVKSQKQKVDQLRARIKVCSDKIDSVSGINKAITFSSPGEYPLKYKFDPQKNASIFREFLERTRVTKFDLSAHYQMKHDVENLGEKSKLQINQMYGFVMFLYGKLKNVKSSSLERDRSIAINKQEVQTIGRIPSTIAYVDSLTIFNSNINPYKKYQLVDNSLKNTYQKKNQLKKEDIPEAGQSLKTIQPFQTDEYDAENRNYKPTEKPIKEIDFDMDIGIDGVVSWEDAETISREYPLMVEKTVAKDPYLNKQQKDKNQNPPNQEINAPPSRNLSMPPSPPSLNTSSSVPPPPPPPPPPTLNTNSSVPPPPPPPPPPTLSTSLSTPPPPPPPPTLSTSLAPPPPLNSQKQIQSILGQAPPPESESRCALMQELNNPNPMARLKKTITKQVHGSNSKQKPQLNGNGQNESPPIADQERPRAMSLMQALQMKIKNRFIALHPEREEVAEESDDE